MLGVVLGAIRARAAQAAILFALTALAVATATAAPWYVGAAARSVALARVDGAQPGLLVARAIGMVVKPAGPAPAGAALIEQARTEGQAAISVPGASGTASLRLPGNAAGTAAQARVILAHRERACEHVIVEGACPAAAGEAMLTRRTAELLRVGVGDRVTFTTDGSGPLSLRVVGVYQLRDPLGSYWALSELAAVTGNQSAASDEAGEPILVPADTLAALPIQQLAADYHLVLPREAFLGNGGYDLAADLRRQTTGSGDHWRVETGASSLAERVADERRLLNLGVTVAAAQLLLLAWLALFFATRHTAEQRRADLGLLKLRGGARWRVWSLAVAQSVLPMLAGALTGLAGGAIAARLLAGEIGDPGRARDATLLSVAAAGAAVAGALAAAVVADWRGMRSGVPELLRHVPPRRRGWRADVVDLIVVAVAAGGIYQAYSAGAGPGEATGLVLLAPALIAVVVALAAARALGPLGARAGRRALRTGRLPTVLTAIQLARRPGIHRVFALLTVAVAVFATAVSGWSNASDARERRAAQEVGADRVLTVQVRSRAQLLAAVRAADPGGANAMAVVRNGAGGATGQTMIAVDSPRFARVAAGMPEYRLAGGADLAALLRPAAPPPVLVPDGELTLDVAALGDAAPPLVLAQLVTPSGAARAVTFGPLAAGRGSYRAVASGCGRDSGCRLVGFDLAAPTPAGRLVAAPPGSGVALYGLTGSAGPVLTGALLGDVGRWRSAVQDRAPGSLVAPYQGRLTVRAPAERAELVAATRAYLIDAPVPVPVVRNGPAVDSVSGDPREALFGVDRLPVRTVATTDALPQVDRFGYLIDLEYADRLVGTGGTGDIPQVWLRHDAPADLVQRLRQQGLTILSGTSIAAAESRLDRQGPPSALRFQLAAGLIGLLLAAGALTVAAAVERPDRTAELAALRVQGLPAAAIRRVAYGGYLLLVAGCLLLGVGAAVLAGATVRSPMPYFVDNWQVLPLASGPAAYPLLLAALGGLLVLGPAAVAASAQLVRAVAGRGDGSARRAPEGRA